MAKKIPLCRKEVAQACSIQTTRCPCPKSKATNSGGLESPHPLKGGDYSIRNLNQSFRLSSLAIGISVAGVLRNGD